MIYLIIYLIGGLLVSTWTAYQRWYYITAQWDFRYLLLMGLALVVVGLCWPAFLVDLGIKCYKLIRVRVSK